MSWFGLKHFQRVVEDPLSAGIGAASALSA